jgi:hypothetical protein
VSNTPDKIIGEYSASTVANTGLGFIQAEITPLKEVSFKIIFSNARANENKGQSRAS